MITLLEDSKSWRNENGSKTYIWAYEPDVDTITLLHDPYDESTGMVIYHAGAKGYLDRLYFLCREVEEWLPER